ncbi:MAG TPA: HAMP domain-containing sensor histidine kinase [Lysobacter sp.]|nr:HAMP domain-containing sensor histidine kinase [Lysobacter sp.]
MTQGLPRKIKFAFLLQALIASVAITLGIVIAGWVVGESLQRQRLEAEAVRFWDGRVRDPAYPPPRSSTVWGHLRAPGAPAATVPTELRALAPGWHDLDSRRAALVQQRPEGTLYLVLDHWVLNRTVLWMGLASGVLSLLVTYFLTWLTYRTSKRLVAPVSWLADVVSQWDPRGPDPHSLGNLPAEAGREVHALAASLRGLAARIGDFVQREREFTRDASHELRTPLTVIRVATDLMMADPEMPSRAVRSLARVQRAGRDMEAVIDAFLILAREAAVEPQTEEFAVADLVAEEIERVQPLLVGKPIELKVVDDGAPMLVAPPHVLRVMIGNLLSNAVRFTDRGVVEVRMRPDRIEIRDTGIGMSQETLARAFDPFYRANVEAQGGKGMGLSIVRRLGERFGWPVELESTLGVGTVAIIRFAGKAAGA